jgi:hypothetical protein
MEMRSAGEISIIICDHLRYYVFLFNNGSKFLIQNLR